MAEQRIRQLLEELHKELARSDEIDEETLAMVRELDEQVHRLSDPDLPQEAESIADLAATLEAKFATDHPVAERFLRDIIDALGKMGI